LQTEGGRAGLPAFSDLDDENESPAIMLSETLEDAAEDEVEQEEVA